MLQFSHKVTARQFEALVEKDRRIEWLKRYRGMLSNIPPHIARSLVHQRTNLLKWKENAPIP